MALGFPNSNGGRTTDSALFHALGNAFVGSWISGFRVRQASPVGMNVLIGGESGVPDDLLVRDAMSATFPVSNLSTQPIQASVTTANSANPRIDAVVIYIDTNVAASQAVANNENRTKAVVVPGTPATNPSAPTPSQIKAKIGASNPYEIIAEIRVNAGATTILDSVITDRRNPATLADGRINRGEMFKNGVIDSDALADDIVLPRHLGLDFVAVRLDKIIYDNNGSNKARLKVPIAQRGNITIDSSNSEIVIGAGIEYVELVSTIMAEELSTYLFAIVQRKKVNEKYEHIAQSLNAPHHNYAGITISAFMKVSEGDRISIVHDCTGKIRGQYSYVSVKAIG